MEKNEEFLKNLFYARKKLTELIKNITIVNKDLADLLSTATEFEKLAFSGLETDQQELNLQEIVGKNIVLLFAAQKAITDMENAMDAYLAYS